MGEYTASLYSVQVAISRQSCWGEGVTRVEEIGGLKRGGRATLIVANKTENYIMTECTQGNDHL
jgi:hypothetical protein